MTSDKPLAPGKVRNDVLERVVFGRCGSRRRGTLLRPGVGLDCAVLELGQDTIALTSDPITAAGANAGWLAVHIACNDLAACASEPIGILTTVLLPVGSSEDHFATICQDLHRAAESLNVEILGGHSEITLGIEQPIIVTTAIGRCGRHRILGASGCEAGDSLLMTKAAGLEGTAILATDLSERLEGSVGAEVLKRAQSFVNEISVVEEGLSAAGSGASGLHDATEGGIIGAAWEMAEASGLGLTLQSDRVPIRPETLAICSKLSVDPLRLIASGTMLVASPEPERTASALTERGIATSEIGHFHSDGDRKLITPEGPLPLEPPARDEIWRILEDQG